MKSGARRPGGRNKPARPPYSRQISAHQILLLDWTIALVHLSGADAMSAPCGVSPRVQFLCGIRVGGIKTKSLAFDPR
jgi:hypothetical protein